MSPAGEACQAGALCSGFGSQDFAPESSQTWPRFGQQEMAYPLVSIIFWLKFHPNQF